MRVLIADDAVLIREGIASLLSQAGHEVVAQVGDADALLRRARELRPDVAIVDIRMPPTHTDDGIRAARSILAELPDVGVLVLSQVVDGRHAVALFETGRDGVGYLLKDRVLNVDAFLESLARVARGGSVVDPEVMAQLVARRRDDPLADLTARERDVLALMAEGLSNRAIGQRLFLGTKTVEGYVSAIFLKLALPATSSENRRVRAVLAFLRADGVPNATSG
jgi:DNA-binding NarL/FixJ family response regulator